MIEGYEAVEAYHRQSRELLDRFVTQFKEDNLRSEIFTLYYGAIRDVWKEKEFYKGYTNFSYVDFPSQGPLKIPVEMPEKIKAIIQHIEKLLAVEISGEKVKAFVYCPVNNWYAFKKYPNVVTTMAYHELNEDEKQIFSQYSGYFMTWYQWLLKFEERFTIDPLGVQTKINNILNFKYKDTLMITFPNTFISLETLNKFVAVVLEG